MLPCATTLPTLSGSPVMNTRRTQNAGGWSPDRDKGWSSLRVCSHMKQSDHDATLDAEYCRRWLISEEDQGIGTPVLGRGSEVVVTSGRKVPKGTRGVIRWLGSRGSSYGMRVGIAVPDQERLSYTYAKNVTMVYPGLGVGEVPCGGWQWLYGLHQEDRHLPQKGHMVRMRSFTGQQGRVFWVGGDRIGFGSGDNAIWAASSEVEHLCTVPNEMFGTVDEWVAYDPHRIAAVPQRDPDEWEKVMAPHPHPFCDIRSFIYSTDHPRSWQALDEEGELVCTLTDSAVRLFPLVGSLPIASR